ncbi:hypothetical protein WA158_007179 [Blastocystis sp. Blastoise]
MSGYRNLKIAKDYFKENNKHGIGKSNSESKKISPYGRSYLMNPLRTKNLSILSTLNKDSTHHLYHINNQAILRNETSLQRLSQLVTSSNYRSKHARTLLYGPSYNENSSISLHIPKTMSSITDISNDKPIHIIVPTEKTEQPRRRRASSIEILTMMDSTHKMLSNVIQTNSKQNESEKKSDFE